MSSFNDLLISHWKVFTENISGGLKPTIIDGHTLNLATVVAVARYGLTARLHDSAIEAVVKGAEVIQTSLTKKQVIYGVNTGFGGSANTRTQAVEELQRELIRGLHYGILVDPDNVQFIKTSRNTKDMVDLLAGMALPLDDPVAATNMPESWVRASMFIRLNSLATGTSGVKISTIQSLIGLLDNNIIPKVPLRGSISASGDLSPLSYIGGAMQGKPSLSVWTGDRRKRRVAQADVALVEASIKPIRFGPKEGLAIVNGTAVSAGVGALAVHEAHLQAMLSQILTAMAVEALCGTDESFDPFFAEVRPHFGQKEAARNIYAFLAQSRLVYRNDGSEESLRQDRYSIRTTPQWIGPVLEDLLLADRQITTECNSVTDNPLIDIKGERILHGGNFQAKSITSAMEKTRQSCQTIGRMLYVQCTELINPDTSRGLPPNLVVDEPSESFIWKGTDIMVAALLSELGFLANPVGTHVQSAEMGNQALNSLALISARYTLDALDVLSQISAAHLVALCQAVDLRVMHIRFLETFEPLFTKTVQEDFGDLLLLEDDTNKLEAMQNLLWEAFKSRLDRTTTINSAPRLTSAVQSLQSILLDRTTSSLDTLIAVKAWTRRCSADAIELYSTNKERYINRPDATPFLGAASRRVYRFVRGRLLIPFLREDTIRTPPGELAVEEGDEPVNVDGGGHVKAANDIPPTMGSLIGAVHQSIRTGALYVVVMDCLKDATEGK